MIALEDFQYSLVGDVASEDEVLFGADQPVEVDEDGFNPGTAEVINQDGENPVNGSTRMGIDILTGPTWAFDMFVNEQEEQPALNSLAALQNAWRFSEAAKINGRVGAIRYALGGRTRLVYGRPRQWSATFTNRFLNGMIPVSANFKTVDALHYDDDEQMVTMQFVEGSEGGLILPFTLPAVSDPPGDTEGDIFVGGDHAAYPIIRFTGPVVNPSLTWNGVTLSLTANIAGGDTPDWIEIDTRPWQQSITKRSGASVPGALGRRQYLEDMVLPANQHVQFSFRGTSSSGTATCSIRWRNAHTTL